MDDMQFKESLGEKYNGENKNAWKKFNSIIQGAKIRNIEFNIKFKDYLQFYNMACFYCGASSAIGLDRLDSSIGYKKDNIVSCCTACNLMKGTLDQRDFVFQCMKIAKYQNSIPAQQQANNIIMRNMEEHEEGIIRESLNRNNTRVAIAKELDISTTTLWRKMKKYGIDTKPVVI